LVAARAELRSTRALQDAIASALAQRAVQPELAAAAEQALASADATDPTVARAHVLLALARGLAPPVAGVAFSAAPGEELARVSAGAPLWRDAEASVPDGVIAGLEGLPDRGALATMVLAIAVLRAGDEARARELADGVLKGAADESIAIALLARIDAARAVKKEPTVAGGPGSKGREPKKGQPAGEAKVPASDAKTPPGSEADPTSRLSVDALIDRGCAKVEGGSAKEGIELLKKAHERRPADVDAALCLGQGYAKLGSHAKALEFFENALDRSPTMRAALAGAGKSASRLGQEKSALQYYRRLLAQDPDHAAALEYVRAHEGGGESPGG
jgi:tetratricopeptide (TPR) repeat protein